MAKVLLQIGGDVGVVEGGEGECPGGEFAAECIRTLRLVQRFENP